MLKTQGQVRPKRQSDLRTAFKLVCLWAGLVCAWALLIGVVLELAVWVQFADPVVKS